MPFGTAEHHETKHTQVFAGKDNNFIKHYQHGDSIQVFFKVGGGGGHHLHVKHCKIVLAGV
jgi:hypothetical protein